MNPNNFSSEEVKLLFTELCEGYFDKNFGTLAKSNIDLIMFHHYLNHKKRVTNKIPSDYEISKELGISQSRVRTLKTKDYLQNDNAYDWKKEFLNIVEQITFVEKSENIELMISDVNLMMELRHFLEEQQLIDEYLLNPKVFRCSIDVFFRVCDLLNKNDPNFTLNNFKNYLQNNGRDLSGKPEKSLKNLLKECAPELLNALPRPLNIYGNLLCKVFNFLKK